MRGHDLAPQGWKLDLSQQLEPRHGVEVGLEFHLTQYSEQGKGFGPQIVRTSTGFELGTSCGWRW